jgi:hypothetical protein
MNAVRFTVQLDLPCDSIYSAFLDFIILLLLSFYYSIIIIILLFPRDARKIRGFLYW